MSPPLVSPWARGSFPGTQKLLQMGGQGAWKLGLCGWSVPGTRQLGAGQTPGEGRSPEEHPEPGLHCDFCPRVPESEKPLLGCSPSLLGGSSHSIRADLSHQTWVFWPPAETDCRCQALGSPGGESVDLGEGGPGLGGSGRAGLYWMLSQWGVRGQVHSHCVFTPGALGSTSSGGERVLPSFWSSWDPAPWPASCCLQDGVGIACGREELLPTPSPDALPPTTGPQRESTFWGTRMSWCLHAFPPHRAPPGSWSRGPSPFTNVSSPVSRRLLPCLEYPSQVQWLPAPWPLRVHQSLPPGHPLGCWSHTENPARLSGSKPQPALV